MSRYRRHLPHHDHRLLLTDAGLETELVFNHGLDLPAFAAYPLLEDAAGRELLETYYRSFARLGRDRGLGVVLETPTWRANRDWGARIGHDAAALRRLNREAVALLLDVRASFPEVPVVISGNLGPRGDGYVAGERMTVAQAQAYHRTQIETFAETEADLVSFFTGTYVEEVIGVVEAARASGMPVVASFTVETDGRLPSGQPLGEAVEQADAATGGYATSFGINCAHPEHFEGVLRAGSDWVSRIGLLRANASRRSHAELDAATELDDGDPDELATAFADLVARHPSLRVVGGCCGTDHRHVSAIARSMAP